MQKVIDLRLDVPATTSEIAKKIKDIFFDKDCQAAWLITGVFLGPRWAAVMGTSLDEIDAENAED